MKNKYYKTKLNIKLAIKGSNNIYFKLESILWIAVFANKKTNKFYTVHSVRIKSVCRATRNQSAPT